MKKSLNNRARVLVLLALSLSLIGLLLSACGTTPTPTVTPTSVPAPTFALVPTATRVPVPAATTAPTQAPQPTALPAATAVPAATQVPAATAMPAPTSTPPKPTTAPEPTPTLQPVIKEVKFEASAATITIDGDTADWAAIPGAQVTLRQIGPIPGVDMGQLDPVESTLKVAADSDNIYVLVEVPDDYDFVAEDHGLSAALAVMFRIDDPAAPHMGTTEEDQDTSLGKVDIWHWELDCGAGEMSGGNAAASGNDPDCNLDDEYSTTPEEREDDGTAQAENSIAGVWEHTARAQGAGAEGTWIFEMSRPLNTGDPDDAQLQLGGTANLALAYWDADETAEGWTAAGHVQSSTGGWIQVAMPGAAS